MPITVIKFDTLEEFQAYQSVQPTFQPIAAPVLPALPAPRQPKARKVAAAKPKANGAKTVGRPKRVAAPKPPKMMTKVAKTATEAPAVPRRRRSVEGGSLTDNIRNVIEQFIQAHREFTANDVYAQLAQSDKEVNKQSVITSVLKLMKTQFVDINVTERPGNGPRPVKVYRP